MILADAAAMPGCAVIATWLTTPAARDWPIGLWLVPLGVGHLGLQATGFYRSIVRFMGIELIFAASRTVTVTAIALAVPLAFLSAWQVALKGGIAFWLLGMVYVTGSRFLVRLLLQ